MSRIGNFIVWFEEEGYDIDDEKSIQRAFDDYMKTDQYLREHDEQEKLRAGALKNS